LASLEVGWHFQKEMLKNVSKLKKVLAFANGAVKKVFASLEMCWYFQKSC